jgi:hypothetical protein
MGFFPFLEDLEPRLRPNLGRKLGCDPQLKFYLNPTFFPWKTSSEQQNDEEFVKSKPFLCREARRVAELWRPFLGVLLHLFQCRLLH